MRVKVFAPGRISLIEEHTDYNESFVLPLAELLIPPGGGKNWWDYPTGICWPKRPGLHPGCGRRG